MCLFSGEDPLEASRSTPIVFLGAAGPPAPLRLAIAPTRHDPASLTPSPTKVYPSFRILVVGNVTQLGVSRSKEIRLEVCRSLHIYNHIYFELSMFFGQPVDA
jgi:hypothetical protein